MSDELRHTPGPWKMLPPSSDGSNSKRIFAGNKYIATVGNSDQEFWQVVTNAKLIAAAPDLVEALQAIVKHQESVGGGLAVLSVTRKIAQDALDKAGVS